MRSFLKTALEIALGTALIYGLPGVASSLNDLSKSPHWRLIQAVLAVATVLFAAWWNLGRPQIRINGMPWQAPLFFPREKPGRTYIKAVFVGLKNNTRGRDNAAIGKAIVAKVVFFTKNWKIAHECDGAWVGRHIDGRRVDLYPRDSIDLHVAVAVEGKLYAVDAATYNGGGTFSFSNDRFTNAGPELPEDGYMVQVMLIGENVSQTFWFDLLNFAKNPDVLGFYKTGPWPRLDCWYYLKFEPWLQQQLQKQKEIQSRNL